MSTHIHIHVRDGLVTSAVGTAVKAAKKLNELHARAYSGAAKNSFEEGKHPRSEGGQFTHKEVLQHYGWKPGGITAGYFNHPNHPGHQIAVRATKYHNVQEWSHSVAKRAGAKTRRGLNMGNTPESFAPTSSRVS